MDISDHFSPENNAYWNQNVHFWGECLEESRLIGAHCVSAPNWNPTLKDDNLLKLKTSMPGLRGPDRRRSGPHPFDYFTFDFNVLQSAQQGARFGAD
jgi:hypothetical protein